MTITICGDFVPIGRGVEAVKNKTAISSEVRSVLKESDIAIVNFESPVADKDETCIAKNGPSLSTSPEAVAYLKECGVDVVTLANNHFYDHGHIGVEHTVDACNKYGLQYVGGGLSQDDLSRILYVESSGLKIAILNYCENEFSVRGCEGSNAINPVNVFYDINKAKKEKADYIVVITHGGHEGYQLPSPRMKQLYRYFIDLGATTVINHHQHCYSGFEEYNTGVIFYGLGNFFFDDFRPKRHQSGIWNSGYMVRLIFQDKGFKYEVIPYKQCEETASTRLLQEDERSNFNQSISMLNSTIASDSELEKSFRKWSSKQKKLMLSYFTPYSDRILMALARRGVLPKFLRLPKRLQLLNMIMCESHRDIVLDILKQSIYNEHN